MGIQKIINKSLLVLFMTVALFFFGYTLSFAGEDTQFVKIGLKYISAAPATCQITGSEDLAVWNYQGEGDFYSLTGVQGITVSVSAGELHTKGVNGEELTVEMNGETKRVSELVKEGYALVSNRYLDYLNAEVKDFDSIIYYDAKAYRGGLCFFVNANDTFNVINKCSIDEYTYGVINGEMGYSNPLEALKAQAVVARSYALTNTGRHAPSGYDLCDSTHCQVYKGYSDEKKMTNQAVDETQDLGIYHEGLPVAAFFYKNSGGYTQNVEDVWNSKLGYLRGVKDIYSPLYKWNVQFTFSEIESKLRAAGYNVGNLKSVSIVERNSSGAVAALEFTGDEGKVTIAKEKIRTILGMTVIKSTMFSLKEQLAEISRGLFVRDSDTTSRTEEKVYVLDGSGKTVELNRDSSYVMNGSLSCSLLETGSDDSATTGDVVTFDGSGYGHGIGMPQDSAIEMAKLGFTFREILDFYYTEIEIK